ncbi:putative deoxycholate-binding periplasmic protein YgiS [Carnimonas sp. R-84981]|uniref:peptide ABC transporter substrate-binding protein n=1 Tax=Carnimonas bestiolae TaxID=3402172 RepID=UPI003EDBCDE0
MTAHLPARSTLLSVAFAASAAVAPSADAATLRLAIQAEPSSLAPSEVNGTVADGDVIADLYEGLTSVDAEGAIIPGAASEWQVSDNGKRYTFTLRDSARWADGKPVIADDFVSAFRAALNPESPSVYAALLYPLKNAQAAASNKMSLDKIGIHAKDNDTVVIELERPTPYLPALLANSVASPIPTHLIRSKGDKWKEPGTLVTNGAFTPTSWVPHDHLSATKNRYFHDADDVKLEGVEYIPTEGEAASVQRFRAKEFDILRSFPVNQITLLKKQLGDQVKLTPELNTYYYALNQREGQPTADKRVREALNLAIDRDIIAQKVMQDTVKPASGLVPPGVSNYHPAHMRGLDEPLTKRQQRARELLKEAGYDSEHPLNITLNYNKTSVNQPVAVVAAAMWKAVGIHTSMANTEANVHFSNLAEGKFGVGRATWLGDYDDANTFLDLLTSDNAKNYGAYKSSAYDALLDKANSMTDLERRAYQLRSAEQLALDDYALLPIYFDTSRNLVADRVHGWQANTINRHLSRWLSIAE